MNKESIELGFISETALFVAETKKKTIYERTSSINRTALRCATLGNITKNYINTCNSMVMKPATETKSSEMDESRAEKKTT